MDRKRNPVAVYDVEQPAVPHITAVFDTKACADPKRTDPLSALKSSN